MKAVYINPYNDNEKIGVYELLGVCSLEVEVKWLNIKDKSIMLIIWCLCKVVVLFMLYYLF